MIVGNHNKKTANYYGDTHFNAYTRGKQHLEKYKSSNKNTQEKLQEVPTK